MNRLEQIKKQISGPYGIQAITSHDVEWLIQELEKAMQPATSTAVNQQNGERKCHQ